MQVLRELRDEKLDFWIKHNFNVLLIGHYGTGKTTRILEAFTRNNLRFKYFSAATMDPWCDFVGIPKVSNDENGPYLDYILPRDFRDDTIEAIYMDEFNRSHKKVRNAVLELHQFKSINGRKFKNLRMIWAAINPEDEGEYQVEALDPAQQDRFEIQVAVPYAPNLEYFSSKFEVKQAKAAVNWWQSLSPEQQMKVSPRRLEYALRMFNLPGGNIKDVLPHSTNVSKLVNLLKIGPIDERMKELLKANNLDTAKQFMEVENNYTIAIRHLCDHIPNDVNENDWKLFFLQSISTEKLSSLIATNEIAFNFIVTKRNNVPIFDRMIKDILNTNTDKNLVRRLKKEIGADKILVTPVKQSAPVKPYFSSSLSGIPWETRLAGMRAKPMDTTPQRVNIYRELVDWIPKILTSQEAVSTLAMLNMLANRSHANTFTKFRHLIGIINHCIDCIHQAGGLSWKEILVNYGQKFDTLLSKIRDSGNENKLYYPLKKGYNIP